MRVGRNLLLSAKALLRHRVRTALALSGTAVGVGAVLVMTAVGEGAEERVVNEIEALGRNLLVVSAADADRVPWRPRTTPKVTTLTPADAEAILQEVPLVRRVAPARDGTLRIKYGRISTMTKVLGTTPDYEEVRNFRCVEGRYFTEEEDRNSARVVVLGSRVRDLLFPGEDPLGKTLRVGKVSFLIIGVLESKGSTVDGLSGEDNQVVIPLQTALRRVFNLDHLNMAYVQVRDGDRLEEAQDQIAAVLRARHRMEVLGREDDFAIQSQRLILTARMEAIASFRRMILWLGSVALLAGGVGILSIMLLSVRERRNEVGLRVAVGARQRDILTQFLLESLFLGVAGGVVGVFLGLGVSLALSAFSEWTTRMNYVALGVGLGSSLLVGVVFGVFPAQRAAALDPIEALRAE
jgi:putative ABC transport system permease protein